MLVVLSFVSKKLILKKMIRLSMWGYVSEICGKDPAFSSYVCMSPRLSLSPLLFVAEGKEGSQMESRLRVWIPNGDLLLVLKRTVLNGTRREKKTQ